MVAAVLIAGGCKSKAPASAFFDKWKAAAGNPAAEWQLFAKKSQDDIKGAYGRALDKAKQDPPFKWFFSGMFVGQGDTLDEATAKVMAQTPEQLALVQLASDTALCSADAPELKGTKEDGDNAELTVHTAAGDSTVKLVREDGDWKAVVPTFALVRDDGVPVSLGSVLPFCHAKAGAATDRTPLGPHDSMRIFREYGPNETIDPERYVSFVTYAGARVFADGDPAELQFDAQATRAVRYAFALGFLPDSGKRVGKDGARVTNWEFTVDADRRFVVGWLLYVEADWTKPKLEVPLRFQALGG